MRPPPFPRGPHNQRNTTTPASQVTHDVTDICKADFLKSVGKKTHVAARFSTVVHPAGSPESLRDVRGFSVKFYTQQGNWDFVGNSIPVRCRGRAQKPASSAFAASFNHIRWPSKRRERGGRSLRLTRTIAVRFTCAGVLHS